MTVNSNEVSLRAEMEVLVVEDEPRIRSMLAQALREMGFRSTLTSTAEDAEKLLLKEVFDIAILDLNLPGMSGLDFLSEVRSSNPGLQAIVLTGYGDLASAKCAIHLDVVEFLSKPCSLGELERALDRAKTRRKSFLVGTPAQVSVQEARRTKSDLAGSLGPGDGETMEDIERLHILRVLQKNQGNRAAAAAELGISLRKLYYRLGEYQKKGLIP